MTISRDSGPSWRLAPALVALLALAGCGSDTASSAPSQPASQSPSQSPSQSASPSPSPSASRSPVTPSPVMSPSAGPATCTSASLRVGMSDGEGAAGSVYYTVRLTNTSRRPCRTGGFGGVSLVHTATGDPVGAPADRVDQASAAPLTLPPGATASATLQVSQAANYPAASCRPTATAGFRVYPPNQTRSSFVARSTTGCRSAGVHLLRLMPYRRG